MYVKVLFEKESLSNTPEDKFPDNGVIELIEGDEIEPL